MSTAIVPTLDLSPEAAGRSLVPAAVRSAGHPGDGVAEHRRSVEPDRALGVGGEQRARLRAVGGSRALPGAFGAGSTWGGAVPTSGGGGL
jgi:hypothetical protein